LGNDFNPSLFLANSTFKQKLQKILRIFSLLTDLIQKLLLEESTVNFKEKFGTKYLQRETENSTPSFWVN
jgi:hypothetical protein